LTFLIVIICYLEAGRSTDYSQWSTQLRR